MTRKTLGFVLLAFFCLFPLWAGPRAEKTAAPKDGVRIVCSIFPVYDWVRNIAHGAGESSGDGNLRSEPVSVEILVDNGADMHSYQPSVQDVLKIIHSDAMLYVGGESDEWIEEALQNRNAGAAGSKREECPERVVNLLDLLGDRALEEERIPGMEGFHEGSLLSASNGFAEENSEEVELDEHVWLSPENAKRFVPRIADLLCDLDPGNADIYRKNALLYMDRLSSLDQDYREAVSQADVHTLVFGDRFPFRYLVEDYGLSYYAAFAGCDAETEASFGTIVYLAGIVDELDLRTILTIEGSDVSLAESIRKNTTSKNQRILALNSMQTVSRKEIEHGADYIGIMRENLEVLKEALSR